MSKTIEETQALLVVTASFLFVLSMPFPEVFGIWIPSIMMIVATTMPTIAVYLERKEGEQSHEIPELRIWRS